MLAQLLHAPTGIIDECVDAEIKKVQEGKLKLASKRKEYCNHIQNLIDKFDEQMKKNTNIATYKMAELKGELEVNAKRA